MKFGSAENDVNIYLSILFLQGLHGFLEDLEEDSEYRRNINIYKGKLSSSTNKRGFIVSAVWKKGDCELITQPTSWTQ